MFSKTILSALLLLLSPLAFAQDDCDTEIEEIGVECPDALGSLVRYPDPDNCQNYWQCKDGCATLEDCGEGFLFSEEDNVCDNAGNVDCGDRPNEGGNTGGGEDCLGAEPGEYDCGEDGYYEDPDNCIKYFHCVAGEATRCTCDKGGDGRQTYWLQDKEWCDYDENVDCSDRPICNEADEQCYAEGESICSTVDCSQDGYVAEGSCEKCLCECEGGDAEELCCSSGLFWDPADDACKEADEIPSCDGEGKKRR